MNVPKKFDSVILITSSYTTKLYRQLWSEIQFDQNFLKEDNRLMILQYTGSNRQSLMSRLANLSEEISEDNSEESHLKLLIFLDIVKLGHLNNQEDELGRLLSICNYVFYVSVDENQLYKDSVLNRKKNDEYFSSIWPDYVESTQLLLSRIEKSDLKGRFFIIDYRNEKSFNLTREFLRYDQPLNPSQYASFKLVQDRLNKKISLRGAQNASEIIQQAKSSLFSSLKRRTDRWINILYGGLPEQREECIRDILKEYFLRHIYHEEEKSILKLKLAFPDKDSHSSVTICSLLILEAIRLCEKRSQFKSEMIRLDSTESERTETELDSTFTSMEMLSEQIDTSQTESNYSNDNLILSISSLLNSIASHFIYCHKVLNDPNYINLIVSMFKSSNFLIKMSATRMIHCMIKTDYKRYGSLVAEYEKKNDVNMVKLVLGIILELALFVEIHEENESEDERYARVYEYIDENLSIGSLEILLKGSPDNCHKLSLSDVNYLIKYAMSKKLSIGFRCRLFGILKQVFKYGSINMWRNQIDMISILSALNTLIRIFIIKGSYGVYWEKVSTFYKEILDFMQKDSSEENDPFDEHQNDPYQLPYKIEDPIVITDQPSITLGWGKTNQSSSNVPKETWEKEDLISYIYEFIIKSEDQGLRQEIVSYLRETKSVSILQCENVKLKLINKQVQLKLDEIERKYEELRGELERQKTDKNTRIEELNDLRVLNENFKSKLDLFSGTKSDLEHLYRSHDDDGLKTNQEDRKMIQSQNKSDSDSQKFRNDFLNDRIEMNSENCNRFLEILKEKRDNIQEFRESICESLNQLSIDLYSSPSHFMFEIIQNFEDNDYQDEESSPFMKLYIGKKFLAFCNNEIGFKAKHVEAICSWSKSCKTKDKHIGNKGLGFKSVFLCTSNPMIVSKPYWQFQFKKDEHKDEIAYITPLSISRNEFPPYFDSIIQQNQDANTFIYLPLKEMYMNDTSSSYAEKFFNDIRTNVDCRILLFTNKLSKFVIVNQIENTTKTIECKKTLEQSSKYSKCKCEILSENRTLMNVNVFKRQITLPDYLAKEEKLMNKQVEISLGFQELTDEQIVSCPVFAFLPVYDLGFRFFINCKWSLATNRESLNEHKRINIFYRDQLIELFVDVANNDEQIMNNIEYYLPKKTQLMSDWWKLFVEEIKDKLKPTIQSKLAVESIDGQRKRIYNEQLKDLINDELLRYANIKLIDENETKLDQEDLEYFGCKKFSLDDILEALAHPVSSLNMSEIWWQQLFHHLNINCEFLNAIKVKQANIFLNSQTNKRGSISNECKNVCLYLSDDLFKLKSWRQNLKMIGFSSNEEKSFLLDFLKLPQINVDHLVNFIFLTHKSSVDKLDQLGTHEQVWLDLEFLKASLSEEELRNAFVYVPATKNKFWPLRYSMVSSLLGYDLSNLSIADHLSELDFIDLKSKSFTISQTLDWEYFFLKIGCQLPIVDLNHLKVNFTTLETFNFLACLGENDSQLAVKIIDLLSTNCHQFLCELPVNSTLIYNTQYRVPISTTCLKSIFNNQMGIILPAIELPTHSYELAKKLGITTNYDFDFCVKMLKSLVNNQKVESNLYIEWFLKTKDFLIGNENARRFPNKIKMIALENVFGSFEFYALQDVYCCDFDELSCGLHFISKSLNKAFINKKSNSSFESIKSILINLGCLAFPRSTDIIRCLEMASHDYELFINNNKQSILSNHGYEIFKELFFLLEKALQIELNLSQFKPNSINELSQREQIVSLMQEKVAQEDFAVSNELIESIPIISFDFHVHKTFEQKGVWICFEPNIILTLRDNNLSNGYCFFDLQIAKLCPYSIGLLNCKYVHTFLDIYLEHQNNNIEKTNQKINYIFQQMSQLNDIQVFKTNYLAISFSLKNETDDYFTIWNNYTFAIFDRKYVVCPSKNITNKGFFVVLSLALKNLMKIIHPNKDDEQLANEAKLALLKLSEYDLFNSKNWQIANEGCKEATKFNLNDVIFSSDENCDLSSLSEIYFTSNSSNNELGSTNDNYESSGDKPTSDNMEKKTNFKSNKMIKFKNVNNKNLIDHESFLHRVKEIANEKLNINAQLNLSEVSEFHSNMIEVNYENQKLIGNKAEHFFFLYLKEKYGESFDEAENWRSSAKKIVFPFSTYDDTLGYDFVVKDLKNLFSNKSNDVDAKTCFIEVKASANEWNGKFHISKNELERKDRINKNAESYVVVIVECVADVRKTRIAHIINWTENDKLIILQPENFLAIYSPTNEFHNDRFRPRNDFQLGQNENRPSNANSIQSTPGTNNYQSNSKSNNRQNAMDNRFKKPGYVNTNDFKGQNKNNSNQSKFPRR